MSEPVRMLFRHVRRSAALEQKIRAGVGDLRNRYGNGIHCDVVIERAHENKELAPLCIRLQVHGGIKDIAIERTGIDRLGRRDAYVAVRELFGTAQRMLQSSQRGHVHSAKRVSEVSETELAQAC